jgi:hypothetical protein
MLNFVATVEQFIPFVSQGNFQSRERWQARKVFARLNTLNITWTRPNFFRQFFLRQMSPLSQQCNIFTEPCPMRIFFGLTRRHRQMLAKICVAKHEALHRANRFDKFAPNRNKTGL